MNMLHSSGLSAMDAGNLDPRGSHMGLAFNHLYIICGGYWEGPAVDSMPIFRDCSKLYIYNSHVRRWFCLQTTGECPRMGTQTVAQIDGLLMYVLDPLCLEPQNPSPVYTLHLRTLVWTKLSHPDLNRPTPRNATPSWIYDNKLYMFGGYGLRSPREASLNFPDFEFVEDGSGYFVEDPISGGYWNNQLLSFDLRTYRWLSHTFSGNVPSPRQSHQACLMGDTVVLYGGRHGNMILNDLYTLDMKSFVWKRIDTPGVTPSGRSSHSFSAVSPRKLVMYGGMSKPSEQRDIWYLDVDIWKWSKHEREGLPRWSHSAVVIDNVLYVYGGCDPVFTNDLVELSVGVPSLHNLCHQTISNMHDLYPGDKLSAILPNIESPRILASRGQSINAKHQPLLELMRY